MDVRGRRACRCAVVGAFRWYLPVSIPYLLRRTPCHLLAPKEAHTCVHLLNAGTIPSILRLVIVSFLRTCSFFFFFFFLTFSVSTVLSIDFPMCRGIVIAVVRTLLFSE